MSGEREPEQQAEPAPSRTEAEGATPVTATGDLRRSEEAATQAGTAQAGTAQADTVQRESVHDGEVRHRSVQRTLISLTAPALLIGVFTGVLLWGIDEVAHELEIVLWDHLPSWVGVAPDSAWWIIGTLTATGAAVGLIIRYAPGHGGHDPAKVELVAPPLPLSALPGVALTLILGLAGGVSLGPESPIIAIAIAIAVWFTRRFARHVTVEMALMMAAAGMLGAMFGSPVAAALLLTEMVAAAKRGGLLWDRLFAPVAAAAAAALTADWLGVALVAPESPGPVSPTLEILLWGIVAALGAAVLGIGAAWAMPRLWRLFRTMRTPVLYATIGGLVLGILGAVGGPITLFKGAQQTADLVSQADTFSTAHLIWLAVIKTLALTVAAAAGFRGGRIFPAVFIGAAAGLAVQSLAPELPLQIALACGVLGAVLAIGRDGWLALFLAVAVSGEIALLAALCIVMLPVWLLVTGGPEMLVHDKEDGADPHNVTAKEERID
ncbi:ion channel protein [Demequina sp. NBRC 110053]|uniref:ion channel protein n=1 Tax=Demequina sp. NBRC 110053 TaxID=1570342 RepID=UPI000A03FE3D|nr:ion channel protein [Demequina sp. NBRC 110053]